MTRFYLIRHGEKEVMSGDTSLSQQGFLQAYATAHYLRDVPIQSIYSSPARRAKETAGPIAAIHCLAVIEDRRLRKRANWGDLPGQSMTEFIEMWNRSTYDPDYVPPIGDSAKQAGRRMDLFLREKFDNGPSDHVVIVSHGGLFTDFLVHALPIKQLERWHPDFLAVQSRLIPVCSITIVCLEAEKYILEDLGSVSHLTDSGRLPLV